MDEKIKAMKKVGIIGAGVTGLSAARFLQDTFEVEVLEAKAVCGGIARTRDVNGIAYHVVGGHCFNSKFPEIMDFVFNDVLPRDQWNLVQRISKIRLGDNEYIYPIEFSVKAIFKDHPQLAMEMTRDFLQASDTGQYENLAEWFIHHFGRTLAEAYFIPYNRKIWGADPYSMDYSWVADKLPIPDKMSFFKALVADATDDMPHAKFYYPKSNNQNTFIDALAQGVNIRYNCEVRSIKYDDASSQWIVNDEYRYDILINTSPIDRFPLLIKDVPQSVIDAARKLRYNKISNVLWRTKPTEKTWTYLPESKYPFHRYIHIGSYFSPSQGYSISEAVGEHDYDELVQKGRFDDFLLEPLDYNMSDHAYVVFDHNYAVAVPYILEFLSSIGIYSIGRFGEWQYYNMDVCMKQSLNLANKLKQLQTQE